MLSRPFISISIKKKKTLLASLTTFIINRKVLVVLTILKMEAGNILRNVYFIAKATEYRRSSAFVPVITSSKVGFLISLCCKSVRSDHSYDKRVNSSVPQEKVVRLCVDTDMETERCTLTEYLHNKSGL